MIQPPVSPGVSAEKFEGGLRKTRHAHARRQRPVSEDAARSFAAIGVAVRNQDGTLRATDPESCLISPTASSRCQMGPRTALAVRLFGKSGADLIPFLNQGREGVGALTAELEALGVQISGDTAARAGCSTTRSPK